MDKRVLLTFDLEEFDLPTEYGCFISEEDQTLITNNGLQRLTGLLSEYNIPATFFTTALYAGNNKDIIKSLAGHHEIASHSMSHSGFRESDLRDSKSGLEQITGKQVFGFRMPRFSKIEKSIVKAAGYSYDSSINPTCIPGRYNNLLTPRRLYLDKQTNLIEIPVSVSPVIRFPLFWLSFKNIPFSFYIRMCKQTINKDGYLNLYFHPWEFVDLESFNIPRYIKKLSGNSFSERFEKLIGELKKIGEFTTISGFLQGCSKSPF